MSKPASARKEDLLADHIKETLLAWVDFHKSHDLDSPKLKCCDKTERLFNALKAFEDFVRAEG